MRKYPFGVWLGIAFSLSLAASGLYWSESRMPIPTGASWGTVASVNAEYRAAAKTLTLPHGARWPDQTPYEAASENGEGIAYGAGVGAQWAEMYWFNAWASIAASATVPEVEREDATRRLPQFLKMTALKDLSAADRERFRKMILDAQTGDLSGLQSYLGVEDGGGKGGGAGD